MADPGFPTGAPAPEFGTKTYYLARFFPSNYAKMKEIGPGVSQASLGWIRQWGIFQMCCLFQFLEIIFRRNIKNSISICRKVVLPFNFHNCHPHEGLEKDRKYVVANIPCVMRENLSTWSRPPGISFIKFFGVMMFNHVFSRTTRSKFASKH